MYPRSLVFTGSRHSTKAGVTSMHRMGKEELVWLDGSPTGLLTCRSFCRTRRRRGERMSCWGRKRGSSLSLLQARSSLGVDVPVNDIMDRQSRRPRRGRLPASFDPPPRRQRFRADKRGVRFCRKGSCSGKRKEGKKMGYCCGHLTSLTKHRACHERGGERPGGQRLVWHILSSTLCAFARL
jgi:hypothetical protein